MIVRIVITLAVVFAVAAHVFTPPDVVSQLVTGVGAVVVCAIPLFVLSRRQFMKSAAGSVQTLVCVLVGLVVLLSILCSGLFQRVFSLRRELNGCGSATSVESALVATFAKSKLEDVLAHGHFPPECKQRAKAALQEFQREEPNSVPIFVYAGLSCPNDPNDDYLYLMCFDKGRDLQGVRLREERRDANGVLTVIEEDYPIFVDSLETWSMQRRVIPVVIREANQRKDERLWLEYENRWLNALMREVSLRGNKNAGAIVVAEKMSVRDIPPLYASVPDPNHLDVRICAYDRTGHESKWIQVHASGIVRTR